MAKPEYLEVFLFNDGLSIYIINSCGNTVNSQKVIFFKKSKKMLKVIITKIEEIQIANPGYRIQIRNYTDMSARTFQTK